MPTWDEIMRTATRVEPDRRGYDGGQMFFGAPGTLQHVAGHPERAAKVFLSALDQLAGFAASWPWDFSRARHRGEFGCLVEELEAGVDALRNLHGDLDPLP